MRASVFIPDQGQPRIRIALSEDEFKYLAAGLNAPKVNVEGDVTRGLLIRFSEHHGLTLRLTGKMVEFSCTAQHVRAAPGRVPSHQIFTIKDRSDDGPVLRTEAFPRDFFASKDRNVQVQEDPAIIKARAEKAFSSLQTNGSMKLADLRDSAVKPNSHVELEGPVAAKNPPWQAPAETLTVTQPISKKGPYDDLKDAIALVNSYMEGLDSEVTLVLENNRLRATKKVVVYQDL